MRAFAVEHSVRANGYALVEDERPGRFDLEAAKASGSPEGPAFAALQRGEEVDGQSGPVRARAGDGRGPPRAARSCSPATPAPARRRSRPPPAPSC